ncbi:MAG: carbon-nitrogen hydrolase family protein [Microbacteriaceae bacterium]
MTTIRISVGQYEACTDVEKNLERATELVHQVSGKTDLIVLPENAMYSDPQKTQPDVKYSEPVDGPFVNALMSVALETGVGILVGVTETNTDDSRPFNTLVFITAEGKLGGSYRKIHLYDAFGYKESDTVMPAPAGEPFIFSVKGVTIGAATCYDIRFPEMSRWLVDHGAQVIALPAAWAAGPMKELHWEVLARARAIENTVYFVASGQTGPSCTGQSMIIDPMGVIQASAGEAAGAVATASISTERLEMVRAMNPSLSNRKFTVSPL